MARPQGLEPPAEIIRPASIRSCGRGIRVPVRAVRNARVLIRAGRGPVRASGSRTVPGRVRRARVTRLS